MTHQYADPTTRQEVGLTKIVAISDAKHAARKNNIETVVYFKRWDHDLYPPDRYDWTTAAEQIYETRDRNVVWSSEEGYYG